MEIQILADNYQLVTIEKWYTACGSKHPIQNGPWCDVEKPMYSAFNKIKAKNPNVTTIMYVISIFYAHFNEKRILLWGPSDGACFASLPTTGPTLG